MNITWIDTTLERLPGRIPALDGWRGISILCVLAGHMLPLGPKSLRLNIAVPAAGMSLFFILSGFLIVSMLLRNPHVPSFLVRRIFRIVPLAWAYLIIVLTAFGGTFAAWKANLLFYANLPPFYLQYENGHFWSLGVEMQFYAAIALGVACLGRRGLSFLPLACILITGLRIMYGEPMSIVTWFRIDEILAGGCLALAMSINLIRVTSAKLPQWTPFIVLPIFFAACHPTFGPVEYLRPYLAAALIGSTIRRPEDSFQRALCGPVLRYLAEISYALYVIHPLTYTNWLGQGDVIVRYVKRVGSFCLTFLFAHLSTRYYERYWIDMGHRIAARIDGTASAGAALSVSTSSTS